MDQNTKDQNMITPYLTPKVSIGMPIYNGEQFICDALDSLLAQTYSNFELIISDNASTDKTEQICRSYASRDKRIRYIKQQQNKGAPYNFQFVLNEAIGEYFMWAAADDRRHERFLELSTTVLEEDKTTNLVFSDMKTLNLLTGESSISSIGHIINKKKHWKYLFRLLNECPSFIYGLHRTQELKKIEVGKYDFFDVHLSHHYEMNSNIKVIPLVLYTAGTNGNRIPYSLTDDHINPKTFLRNEWNLLKTNISTPVALLLYILALYIYKKQTAKINNTLHKNQ